MIPTCRNVQSSGGSEGLNDTYVGGFVTAAYVPLFLLSFSIMCDSIWYQPFEALVFLDGRFHICSPSPANRSPCFPLPSAGSTVTERLSPQVASSTIDVR